MNKTESYTDYKSPKELCDFMNSSPQPQFIEAFVVDINGVIRGKRFPISALPRIYEEGFCLPAATPLVETRGTGVEGTGMVMDKGDSDYFCRPVASSLRPLPWSSRPGGQVFMQMYTASGSAFVGDPRNLLAQIVDRISIRGLTPVVAMELEFYLFEQEPDRNGSPHPAANASIYGGESQLYGLEELERLDSFFSDVEASCVALGLTIETVVSEQGRSQYEINLRHVPDAILGADQAVLLKRAVKSHAEQHGMIASFMAKPHGDTPGSGMHIHVSLVDEQGNNVFTENGEPSDRLMQSVAGLVSTMPDILALLAPNANSYRRFLPDSHVPLAATWGIDNRTTALRLPLANAEASRIEHRVAGADANPYLALSSVLAGIDHGMEERLTPPPAIHGNAIEQESFKLPNTWGGSLERFDDSAFISNYFGSNFKSWYSACKHQERENLLRIIPPIEYKRYLRTV